MAKGLPFDIHSFSGLDIPVHFEFIKMMAILDLGTYWDSCIARIASTGFIMIFRLYDKLYHINICTVTSAISYHTIHSNPIYSTNTKIPNPY